MRSPWLIHTTWRSPGFHTPSMQRAFGADRDLGAAEFAVVAAFDLAAELLGHGHLAVADAEHRHAGSEDRLRRAGAALVGHRGRAAGEDHRLGLQRGEGGSALWNGAISQ